MEKTFIENLLKLATAYAKATDRSMKTVSKEAYGSAYFFEQLKAGEASITVQRADKLLRWFGDNWPTDVAWPTLMPVLFRGPAKEPPQTAKSR
jgi:hypothetical protein